MDPPKDQEPPSSTGDAALPELIGGYRILRRLGQGGMGAVFEARQDNPRRTVALKVVTAGVLTDEMRRRFELEAQVLGLLHHPCIAQVYEAGMFESAGGAQPFFAMELIDGVPLVRYADDHGLGTRARLELLARVCDGVQHAHQRGVIHRDLKPENILVDESGQPKILDFGLARATDADVQAATLHTDVGQIMGTIPYMSPEQAAGDPAAIDARSDIYSLGVVAYELVSGHMPYPADNPMVIEALRVVREEDARPLSSVNRSLRGDVETIVGKALEKEPERRYPYASALAEDIRRYLDDQPITARRPSAFYQLRKFARRNRGLVVGIAAVFVALVVGLIGTLRGYVAAEADAQRAQSTADFFQAILRGVDPAVAQGADTTLFKAVLDDTAARIDTELAGRPLVAASIHETMATAYASIAEYESALDQARGSHALYAGELGEGSVDAIRVRQRVVAALMGLQRQAEAWEELREVLALAEARLGPEHDLTDGARTLLGNLYLADEHYDEAAAVYEPILAHRRERYAPDSAELLTAINCLGLARAHQRRYEEAEALLTEALEGRRRAFGETHPETLTVLFNLAGTYSDEERFAEAEALYREALEKIVAIKGERHEHALQVRQSLGNLLHDQQRLEEALELILGVYETRLAVHGAEDTRTLLTEIRLSVTYRLKNRLAEAEIHARHAYEGLRRTLGPDHRETLSAVHSLASIHARRGEFARAEELRLELLDAHGRIDGPDHRNTLLVTSDLAEQYRSQGRDEEAEPLLRRALDGWRRLVGDGHTDTLLSAATLARMLHDQGRAAEAMPLHREFLVGWPRLYGDAHPYIGDVSGKMVENLGRIEHLGPHEPAIRDLLAHHERTLPPESPLISADLAFLAQALVELDRADEALERIESVVERHNALPPPRVSWTYGIVLAALDRPEEAEDMFHAAWDAAQTSPPEERRRVALSLAELTASTDRADEAAAWRAEAEALAE